MIAAAGVVFSVVAVMMVVAGVFEEEDDGPSSAGRTNTEPSLLTGGESSGGSETLRRPEAELGPEESASVGSVRITSTPGGASIWADGRDTGQRTPATIENLPPGTHRYELRLDGYEPLPVSGTVSAGRREDLSGILSLMGPERGQDFALDLGGGEEMEFVWIGDLNIWVGKYEVTNSEYSRFKPEHESGHYESNNRRWALNDPR